MDLRTRGPQVDSLFQSLRNALLAEEISFGHRNKPDDLHGPFSEWWSGLHREPGTDNTPSQSLNSWTQAFEALRRNKPATNDLLRCCQRMSYRRRLFFAEPDYVGSGPPSARVGDRIASISGVSVPMVLRETAPGSERYRVVGPAFVDSLMPWGWSHDKKVVEKVMKHMDGGPDGSSSTMEVDEISYVPWPGSQRALHRTLNYERIVLM